MKWFCFLILTLFSLSAKDLKVLILSLASDDKPYYVELQKVWRTYMNSDPEHIEAYFIKADPNLGQPFKIEDNVIWLGIEETYIPGLTDKTILAMEAMMPRLKEFDFVIRTNISSFYVYPRLLQFMKTLPKTRCYHACENKIFQGPGEPYIPFGSGAGLIFSPDVVKMLVLNKDQFLNKTIVDDVLFGMFFHQRKIPLLIAKRMDILDMPTWLMWKNNLPQDQYHFRLKNPEHRRLDHEVAIHKEMAEMFYHSGHVR